MFSVLLVDDEVNIVKGLQNTIAWQSLDCEVVGIAYDGLKALEIAQEKKPDIVITDITMPKLNGLDLIEQVSAVQPKTVFIVLSCHEDFYYAQKALHMDVCDYIVKETMTRSALSKSIEKAKAMVQQRVRFYAEPVQAQKPAQDPQVASIAEYLQQNLAEHLTLETVSRHFAMNSSYFSRYFKGKFEENFTDYLQRIRVAQAKALLCEGNKSIDQVAFQCGYNNISYFNAAFKKQEGITPGAYRKQQRTLG